MPFDELPLEVAKHYGFVNKNSKKSIETEKVFKKFHEKCDVFLVRKPYYGFGEPDKPIIKVWKKKALIPEERIMNIEDPKRVVDVILGILGILTGKVTEFENELTERQTETQAKEVLASLYDFKKSIHNVYDTQKSIPTNLSDGKSRKTKGLDVDE